MQHFSLSHSQYPRGNREEEGEHINDMEWRFFGHMIPRSMFGFVFLFLLLLIRELFTILVDSGKMKGHLKEDGAEGISQQS